MTKQTDAIIQAFQFLTGERTIKEIEAWVKEVYGEKWKDLSTVMADMVSPTHNGNSSSLIPIDERVLIRVARGKYKLDNERSYSTKGIEPIQNVKTSHIVNQRANSKSKHQGCSNKTELVRPYNKQTDNKIPSSQKVELWSEKRLPFEPKGWLKEMKTDLRESLSSINPHKSYLLYCKFSNTNKTEFFDVENVLLFNVGSGAFSHLKAEHILLERTFESVPLINGKTQYNNYSLYHYTNNKQLTTYFQKEKTVASWTMLRLKSLQAKPHWYWYLTKVNQTCESQASLGENTPFGITISIGVPNTRNVNLTGVCKPILDGIISAYHTCSADHLEEASLRIATLLGKDEHEIRDLLQQEQGTFMGKTKLVSLTKSGVQWNPADDQFLQVELKAHRTQNSNWTIDGEIYTLKKHLIL